MAAAEPLRYWLTDTRRAPDGARLLQFGGAILLATAALALISGQTPGPALALATMSILMVASLAWLCLIGAIREGNAAQGFVTILAIGAGMRAILFASDPILELDYLRYLWDGAAVGAGLTPYATPPGDAAAGLAGPAWSRLAAESGGLVTSVTYGHLSTVYPPVAQAGFALAHWLEPWGLTGLRLVLLGAEIAGLWLLIRLLDHLGRARIWAAVYWCNPLIAKEITNSAHMEALLLPLLIGAVLLALRQRQILAGVMLACAAAVKVWPLVLAPVLFAGTTWQRWIAASATLGAATLILFLPILISRLDQSSGFVAYAGNWERNAALFPLLVSIADWGLAQAGAYLIDPGRIARFIVAAVVGGTALFLAYRQRVERLPANVLAVVALLFLLSPTGYTWYYAWFLPFLCLVPNRGLLLLGAMLPLYYLRFAMVDWELGHHFDTWIVWVEFLPPLALIAWDLVRQRR
ncbi:MAG: glycosyltransferase family 87 protein [Pseudomonadota bacterium]